ncbi:MAG: orotidine-5'-phosphate decarboxylase [Endomicrobium sp.]|jgi:orotidine-5'-phosphate decarboxylase|nr:orotidine-5'-phosphate decarboxylase [Endomicrobium sp.]
MIKRIILALDIDNLYEAEKLIVESENYIDIYKVGMMAFLKFGKDIIKIIEKNRKKIFLDLKFHDIPNTVKYSVEAARDLGVFSITIHSIGGSEMIKAATSVYNRPKIWAVSVLTSQQVSSCNEVVKRAELAKYNGVDGVIASPLDIVAIKKKCGNDFAVITPGIRLNESKCDDQKRIATPEYALKSGASFIIIGRPILKSKTPIKTLSNIYNDIINIR